VTQGKNPIMSLSDDDDDDGGGGGGDDDGLKFCIC
jgi:hypothetical protein